MHRGRSQPAGSSYCGPRAHSGRVPRPWLSRRLDVCPVSLVRLRLPWLFLFLAHSTPRVRDRSDSAMSAKAVGFSNDDNDIPKLVYSLWLFCGLESARLIITPILFSLRDK